MIAADLIKKRFGKEDKELESIMLEFAKFHLKELCDKISMGESYEIEELNESVSQDYLIEQMENSFRAGISKGMRIEFHSITPTDEKTMNSIINEFRSRVDKELEESINNREVWRINK